MQTGEIQQVPLSASAVNGGKANIAQQQARIIPITPINLPADNIEINTKETNGLDSGGNNLSSTRLITDEESGTSDEHISHEVTGNGNGSESCVSVKVKVPLHMKNSDLQLPTVGGATATVTETSNSIHHTDRSRSSIFESSISNGVPSENDCTTPIPEETRPLHEQLHLKESVEASSTMSPKNTDTQVGLTNNANIPSDAQTVLLSTCILKSTTNGLKSTLDPTSKSLQHAQGPNINGGTTNDSGTCMNPLQVNGTSQNLRVVSNSSSSSHDSLSPNNHNDPCLVQHIPPITKNTDSNDSPEKNERMSFDDSDELIPKVPLSFNVDVASALDQVLNELAVDKEQRGKKEDSSSSVHRSPNGKERPCILQQSLLEDSSHSISGASSACGDDILSMDGANSMSKDERSSVSVKSSMLVPEESLNLIAQMTVAPPSTAKPSSKPVTSIARSNGSDKGLATTKIKQIASISDGLANGKSTKTDEAKFLKAPLISGTAAAQFEAFARKNGVGKKQPIISQPLGPPPPLLTYSTKDGTGYDDNRILNEDWGNKSPEGNRHRPIDGQVKRHENGMDMLAKITSHAVPISAPLHKSVAIHDVHSQPGPQQQVQCNASRKNQPSNLDQIMVPVGQSLSVYSAIAAQAGVTTHKPAPIPSSIPRANPSPQQQHQEIVIEQPFQSPIVKETYVREIGKIRRYIAATGEFSEWEDLPCQTYGDTDPRRWCDLNIDESIEIPLRRGGRLRVFPNFVADGRRTKVSGSMDKCTLYRQYCKQNHEATKEARMQVLLSSKVNQVHNNSTKRGRPGYQYDGITMMAQPMSQVPQVEQLARDLAELYRLPEKEWNIGANLVCYRTGEDNMIWHSNCDQGEVLILCIVVESRNCTRPILIRPKGHNPLQDGDEEIIVFVGQGDAYEMDGQMQLSYEHCMPKKEDDPNAKRTVVVFRHGRAASVMMDSGISIFAEPVTPTPKASRDACTLLGHPIRDIVEAKEVYNKECLVKTGAHRQERKLVSGTLADGCESILVEKQDPILREDDGLCWLQITCLKSDGGGALCQSYTKTSPVRVFRSSELDSRYAPAMYEDEVGQILYRYDGLYCVKGMWDSDGEETESAPTNTSKHTFLLTRCPKKPADGIVEEGVHYNRLSIQEVWSEIQKRRGVRKPRVFQVPQPFMELLPIGHKSNLTRKRKDIVKLPSDDCFRKQNRRKKAKSPSPLLCAMAQGLALGQRNAHENKIRQVGTRSRESSRHTDVLSAMSIPSEEDSDCNRPKRKSAAVARSYLQEAMQNKYGAAEKEPLIRRRRSALRDDSLDTTPAKIIPMDDDTSCDSDMEIISKDENVLPPSIPATNINTEDNKGDQKQDVNNDSDNTESKTPDVCTSSLPKKKPATKAPSAVQKSVPTKRSYRKKQGKASKTGDSSKEEFEEKQQPETKVDKTEVTTSEDPVLDTQGVDHSTIQVGYRVYVEYRDVLYKATIRRIRQKNDANEYLIHYDGNKKSNVHWIKSTMIHTVLSKEVTEEAISLKVKGKALPKKELVTEVEVAVEDEESDSRVSVLLEGQKFSLNTEIYAMYRKVLYLAKIRNARLKKNGNCEYLVHYYGFKKAADRWVKATTLHEVNDESKQRFDEMRSSSTDETTVEVSQPVNPEVKTEEIKPKKSIEVAIDPYFFEPLIPMRRTRGSISSNNTVHSPPPSAITLDMGDNDPGVEFLPGSCVFVVREDALYLAKMVKRRKRGKQMDYLVHFDTSSNDHDSWIPLSTIYEINPRTRRIFERTADKREIMNDDDDEVDEKSSKTAGSNVDPTLNSSLLPSRRTKRQKKAPSRYQREEESSQEEKPVATRAKKPKKKSKTVAAAPSEGIDMSNIDSGVDFLPGSTLFVVWKEGLYLGKMLKKRGKGDCMEYFIHYDGFRKSFESWVSVSLVYEINPQTKRAFNKQKKK